MSSQPDADDAPVEWTAEDDYDSSDRPPFWSNPNNRTGIMIITIGVLVVIVLLLLAGRSEPTPVEPTPTLSDLEARPVSVNISGQTFEIELVTVNNGRWQTTNRDGNRAEWVFGTLVPYVIGLHPTSESEQLMESLAEGDAIRMSLSNGTELFFRVSGRQRISVDTTSLFDQTQPGMVLVLLGEGGAERLAVTAVYNAEEESTSVGGSNIGSVGVPVQIADWRVTVQSARLVTEVDPGNPSEAFYFVDFTVEYLGAEPASSREFDLVLIDGVRSRYVLDADVSNRGVFSPPGGLIAPRNPSPMTAGYRVSANIPGPTLIWEFKPNPEAPVAARIELAIVKPTPTPEPNTQLAIINCCTAQLNLDQTLLIISGGIGNETQQQAVIDQLDVSLRTTTNVFSELRSAQPPFPWVIEPGQTMAFELQFTRPPDFSAELQIVNQRFELSGLR